MGTIRNICQTLLRLYNSNVNGNDLDRVHWYYPYFKDLSEHNFWVRTTNFDNNNSIVQAYLNPMDHQLIFRFVDSQARCIPNGTLASNPGLTVHSNIVHVFGVHEAPHGLADNWNVPAHQIITSLPTWGNDDMLTIFECARTLLFGG